MDPTTTLFTFMFETLPSVQSVHLVGSWDNFSRPYIMERDARRDCGQWRGCYNFKDIICDGDTPSSTKRSGGLKMGQPYYYYYELDGSTEAHDPSLPSTSACPFLPGQTVNTMWVPAERSERKRSASLSSLREEDFKTQDPDDKFVTPRPAPPVPEVNAAFRLATSHLATLKHKRTSRSISPTPSWSWSPRKLFTRKNSSSSQSSSDRQSDYETASTSCYDEQRSVTPPERSRARDVSPDSLLRFLSNGIPIVPELAGSPDRLFLAIPDDIAEEAEDDDNFATSATSESTAPTILSPPPIKRNYSSNTLDTLRLPANESVVTLKIHAMVEQHTTTYRSSSQETPPAAPIPMRHYLDDIPTSRFSFSSDDATVSDDDEDDDEGEDEGAGQDTDQDTDLVSPLSPDNDLPSFYHSEAEEEDDDVESVPIRSLSGRAIRRESLEQSLATAFAGYSLPASSIDGGKIAPDQDGISHEPALRGVGSGGTVSPLALGIPLGSVVDDFVSELSWMADVIQGKHS